MKALEKWIAVTDTPQEGLPLFRDERGFCYTGAAFNKDLSIMTNNLTEGTTGMIKPHSFRSAISTEMAKRGFSDSEIQAQGRWNSSSFNKYIKQTRLKRLKFTEEMVRKIVLC